jgi:hypothetical protein
MTLIAEIAPDVFRISTFVPDFNLQFNQFVVRSDEPLLCAPLLGSRPPVRRNTGHAPVLRPVSLERRR